MATPAAGRWRGLLLRLALRRDRVMVPIWYAVLLAASATPRPPRRPPCTPTEAERVQAAEAINASPGLVALYGPILDVHSTGELAMTKMTVLYAVFVAVMLLFVVRRHTRAGRGGRAGGADRRRRDDRGRAAACGDRRSAPASRWSLGLLAAAANVAGGLPVARVARLRCLAGPASVSSAPGSPRVACQLSPSARTCAAIASAAIGVLFVAPRRRGHDRRVVAELALAVRLEHPAAGLRRHPLVGAAAVRRLAGGLVAGAPARCSAAATSAPASSPPRPGPATGSPRLADAIALSLRRAHADAGRLDRGDRRHGPGLRRDQPELRRVRLRRRPRPARAASAAPAPSATRCSAR